MPDPIRVILVDDQSLVRSGFRMLIEAEDDMEVVAEASNGRLLSKLECRDRVGLVLFAHEVGLI